MQPTILLLYAFKLKKLFNMCVCVCVCVCKLQLATISQFGNKFSSNVNSEVCINSIYSTFAKNASSLSSLDSESAIVPTPLLSRSRNFECMNQISVSRFLFLVWMKSYVVVDHVPQRIFKNFFYEF